MLSKEWQVIHASAIGASHIRQKLPNQDSVLADTGLVGPGIVLAASDGHGSVRCFRSATGARLATETSIRIIKEEFNQLDELTLQQVENIVSVELPARLVQAWTNAVMEDLLEHAFSDDEVSLLASAIGREATAYLSQTSSKRLAYGATLLVVVITARFIIYMQLGDGDIIAVARDTFASVRPLPEDSTLFANETTSLCMENAGRLFRTKVEPQVDATPVLIMASTDGYSNAFASDQDFLKVGSDIAALLGSEGMEYVNENLIDWLREASTEGSGDDVSVGLIFRCELAGPQSTAEPIVDYPGSNTTSPPQPECAPPSEQEGTS